MKCVDCEQLYSHAVTFVRLRTAVVCQRGSTSFTSRGYSHIPADRRAHHPLRDRSLTPRTRQALTLAPLGRRAAGFTASCTRKSTQEGPCAVTSADVRTCTGCSAPTASCAHQLRSATRRGRGSDVHLCPSSGRASKSRRTARLRFDSRRSARAPTQTQGPPSSRATDPPSQSLISS